MDVYQVLNRCKQEPGDDSRKDELPAGEQPVGLLLEQIDHARLLEQLLDDRPENDHVDRTADTRAVDRQGRVRDYGYDLLHRVVTETWYANVADADAEVNDLNTILYTYDVLGRQTGVSDDVSGYTYTFDTLDRVTSITSNNVGAPSVVLMIDYGTRLDSLRTSVAATIDGTPDFITSYTYNERDELTRIEQTGQTGGNAVADKRVDLAYDGTGRIVTIARYSDLAGTQLVASTDFVFDELGRLTDLTHAQGATILADYGWTFDAAGRLIQQTSPDGTVDYGYDDTGQLIGADYLGDWQSDEDYQYDDNGNRVAANGDSYSTGDYNRMTFDGTYTYEYDTEGNRTARFIDVDTSGTLTTGDTDVTEYTWDVANRLTAIISRTTEGGPATKIVDYTYDLFGRRIAKNLDNDGDGTVDYAESYVYDETDIVLDFVDDGAGTGSSLELSKRYLWGPAVDQLLAQEDATGTGAPADITWPLTDHLGTVRDLVDSAAVVLTHYQYDTFGNITLGDTTLTRYLFTSQEYDLESGQYYYDARYYDPATGKFINEDIIGFDAMDANFYRYVGNDPSGSVDPDGLKNIGMTIRPSKAGFDVELYDYDNDEVITRISGKGQNELWAAKNVALYFMRGEFNHRFEGCNFKIHTANRALCTIKFVYTDESKELITDNYKNRLIANYPIKMPWKGPAPPPLGPALGMIAGGSAGAFAPAPAAGQVASQGAQTTPNQFSSDPSSTWAADKLGELLMHVGETMRLVYAEDPEAMDRFQSWLGYAGIFPFGGDVFDLVNAGIYWYRGKYSEAKWSVAYAAPGIGTGLYMSAKVAKPMAAEVAKHGRKLVEQTTDFVKRIEWDISTAGMGPGALRLRKVAPKTVSSQIKNLGDDVSRWLGKDAKVVKTPTGDIIVQSADELREIRFDFNRTYPHKNPHTHVIEYKMVKNKKVEIMNRRIYPSGVSPE